MSKSFSRVYPLFARCLRPHGSEQFVIRPSLFRSSFVEGIFICFLKPYACILKSAPRER